MPDDKPLPSLEVLQRDIDNAAKLRECSDKTAPSGASEAAQLAWGVVSGAALGIIGGYELDSWLNTSPWLLIVGLLVGFAGGLFGLMLKLKNKDELEH